MEYYKLILFIVIIENSTYYYLQAHQMALIRKRLAVEMWIYEQLNELHGCTVSYIFRCHKYIGVVGENAIRFQVLIRVVVNFCFNWPRLIYIVFFCVIKDDSQSHDVDLDLDDLLDMEDDSERRAYLEVSCIKK